MDGGIPAASPDVWPSEYYGNSPSTPNLDEQKTQQRRQPQRRPSSTVVDSYLRQRRQQQLFATVATAATRLQQQQHQRQFYPVNSQLPPRISPNQEDKRIEEIAMKCTECVICLGKYTSDEIGVTLRTLKPCGHRFHMKCIDEWLNKGHNCPICRGVTWVSSVSVHGYRCPV
ncbi:hypothetical protein V2J09_006971 [Rumex salicifolius]